MEAGLALGHNVMADEKTLELAAEIGNGRNSAAGENRVKRVRQRFGHPSISADGTGRTIGALQNFRVKDGKLLHDTQFYDAAKLSPAFSGDVVEYVFRMAEEAPESLNESAVIEAALVWVNQYGDETELTDAEYQGLDWGPVEPPEWATTEYPLLRPVDMNHIDLVSDGALTDSLFSSEVEAERFFSAAFSGHSSAYGAELFDLIDRFRDEFGLTLAEIETKGIEIITRYVFARRNHTNGIEGETIMPSRTKKNVSQMAFEQDSGAVVETVDENADAAIIDETATTVNEVEEVEDVESIEDSAEAPDETTVEDDLDEIEAIMADTDDDEDEAESPETVEALNVIQDQVVELSKVVKKQDIRIERVTKLLLEQANQLQAIGRNIRRIDGERVTTQRVPLVNARPEDDLEPLAPQGRPADFTPPLHGYTQPGRVGLRQFSSVIDGDPPDLVLASDTPNAVAEKAAKRRVERNQKYRMGTRK
jgi:hypothetical protein